MITLLVQCIRWIGSWCTRATLLESLGTVDAHKESRYGRSTNGDTSC